MSNPTVAIIGASSDPGKFGHKAVKAYLKQGYDVYPVNPKGGEIAGCQVYASLADVPAERLDRITVYLPPTVGINMLEEFADKPHGDLLFNPGSESDELVEKARELGLEPIVACSIIDIGISPSDV